MIARPLSARTPEEIARLVRALGSHRYVAGRLLLVHAFVFDALAGANVEGLAEAGAWAKEVLARADIDRASRDERLWRAASERELAIALAAFWSDDEVADRTRGALARHLKEIDAPVATGPLFDESQEDELFPVLIDAGWELLRLAELDPERHRGAIDAFGERLAFDCAKFDEESALGAPPPLHELPALGGRELVHGAQHGILLAPLVLWTEGNETYQDYVLRGVLRAAKLD